MAYPVKEVRHDYISHTQATSRESLGLWDWREQVGEQSAEQLTDGHAAFLGSAFEGRNLPFGEQDRQFDDFAFPCGPSHRVS